MLFFFRCMAVVVVMPGGFHLAIQSIDRAIVVLVSMAFKLNGAVSNPVLFGEHGFQGSQNG